MNSSDHHDKLNMPNEDTLFRGSEKKDYLKPRLISLEIEQTQGGVDVTPEGNNGFFGS